VARTAQVLSAIAVAGFGLVAASHYLGPSYGTTIFPLPFRALSLVAAISGLSMGAALLLRRSRWSNVCGAVFIAFAVPLLNTRLISSGDTTSTANLPFVIVREHALTFATLGTDGNNRYDLVPARNGRRASKYPIGTSILSLPFVLPAALGRAPLDDALSSAAHKLAAAAMAAIALGFVILALQRELDERSAALAAAVIFLGTAWLPVISQALWQHTGAVLALSAAVWALFAAPPAAWSSACGGFAAGAAIACRPADLFLGAALLLAFAVRGGWRSGLLPALAGAAVPLGLNMLYQWQIFGSPLATGYGAEAVNGWRSPWPDGALGLVGLLVSPARGILLWSPILLAAFIALLRPERDDPRRAILRLLGAGAIAHALMMACWWAWDGAFSLGPRMLSDELPLLAMGMPRVLRWASPGQRWRALLVALAVWSVASNAAPTFVPSKSAEALVRVPSRGDWTPLAHPLVAYPLGVLKLLPPD